MKSLNNAMARVITNFQSLAFAIIISIGLPYVNTVFAAEEDASVLISLYNQLATLTRQNEEMLNKQETLEFEFKATEKRTAVYRLDTEKRIKALNSTIATLEAKVEQLEKNSNKRIKLVSSKKTLSDKETYDKAIDLLFDSKYKESLVLFASFAKDYPDSKWNSNALYWKGETQYALKNNKNAEATFEEFLDVYKQSEKVPAAMYKLGLIKQKKSPSNAQKIFKKIIADYPQTSAAKLSKKQLK